MNAKKQINRISIWFNLWNNRRIANSLYKKLWEANDILLRARYASYNGDKYSKYFKLLEKCADHIENAIIVVKKDI